MSASQIGFPPKRIVVSGNIIGLHETNKIVKSLVPISKNQSDAWKQLFLEYIR